ncbi:MAG: WYL domain-containing protein, partial [Anaerovoracaceae bacterium]
GSDYESIIKDFVGGSIHNFGSDKKIFLKLEIDTSKIDYMYDEFGDNIIRIDKVKGSGVLDSNSQFKAIVTIETSENQGLYYLLLQFGETVKVLEPAHVRDKYVDTLGKILKKY